MCFSLVDKKTLNQVKTKWVPEIRNSCKNAPILLVGTKLDLLEDQSYIKNLVEAKARGETMDEPVSSGEVRQVEIVKYWVQNIDLLVNFSGKTNEEKHQSRRIF